MHVWTLLALPALAAALVSEWTDFYYIQTYDYQKPNSWYTSWSNSDFIFLDKFCFAEQGGTLSIEVEWGEEVVQTSDMALTLYSDSESQWGQLVANRDTTTCEEKRAQAASNYGFSRLERNTQATGSFNVRVKSARARWWYVVVTNCNGTIAFERLKVTFNNAGDVYKQHFGRDEFYTFEMTIAFSAGNAVLLLLTLKYKYDAKNLEKQYEVLKMTGLSLCFSFLSSVFMLGFWAEYSYAGEVFHGLEVVSWVFSVFADITFMSLLMDIASGWSISTNARPQKRMKIMMLTVYFWCYVIMYIWKDWGIDPAATTYMFESSPGVIIVIVRVLLMCRLMSLLCSTIGYESDRVRTVFYKVFGVFSLLWFFMLPFLVTLGLALSSWNRKRAVVGSELLLKFLGYVFMLCIFRPLGNCLVPVMDPKANVAFGDNRLQIFPDMPLTDI